MIKAQTWKFRMEKHVVPQAGVPIPVTALHFKLLRPVPANGEGEENLAG